MELKQQSTLQNMRTIHRACLLAVLFLAGCYKPERPATFLSADSFTKTLIMHLQKAGGTEGVGDGGGSVSASGHSGNIYHKEISQLLPAERFPPDQLYDAAKAALLQWRDFDTYSKRGYGGVGAQFHLHYGGRRSHAFVDVFAYPERDKTRVDFLIRVVE